MVHRNVSITNHFKTIHMITRLEPQQFAKHWNIKFKKQSLMHWYIMLSLVFMRQTVTNHLNNHNHLYLWLHSIPNKLHAQYCNSLVHKNEWQHNISMRKTLFLKFYISVFCKLLWFQSCYYMHCLEMVCYRNICVNQNMLQIKLWYVLFGY